MKILNKFIEIQETAQRVFTSFSTGKVSIGTSKTSFPSDIVPKGSSVVVRNDPNSGDFLLLGASDENTLDFKLKPGESVTLGVSNTDKIQGKANSGTQTALYIMESEN